MAITKETVEYVARLSRIELEDKELEKISKHLQDILDFIDKLNKINVQDILPTSHILPINNVSREDNLKESLPARKALANAPCLKENFFVVPRVID